MATFQGRFFSHIAGRAKGYEMYKLKLHYDLSEMDNLNDGCGGYITVRAWDDDGHEVSITTNRAGEGLFEKEHGPFGYSMRQVAGTLQFNLPESEGKVRQMLAKRYNVRKAGGFWD